MPTHKDSGEPIAVIQGIDATTGNPADIDVINNATSVYGLARSGADLAAGTTYNTTEVLGFYCEVAGGDWSMTFVGGGTVTFTPTAGTHYPYHLSSITSHASGTGVVLIPS